MSLNREIAIYSYVTILNDLAGVARYLLCFGDAQAHLLHKIHLSGDMRTRKSSDYLPMEKRCLTTRGRLNRHPAFSLRLARERGGGYSPQETVGRSHSRSVVFESHPHI